MSKRLEDYRQFKNYLEHFTKIDSLGADVIGCGTFNLSPVAMDRDDEGLKIVKKNPEILYEQLTDRGFIIPAQIRNMKTNLDKNRSFQSIGYQKMRDPSLKFNKCGTIDFVGAIYSGDREMYNKFTDHLPLWAEFKTKPNKSIYLNP
jgi:hypothetical protein